jgi:hypothetical protein
MAGTTGLEPAASAVTGQRSNQLNYVPTCQINQMRDRQFLCSVERFHTVHGIALVAQKSAIPVRTAPNLGFPLHLCHVQIHLHRLLRAARIVANLDETANKTGANQHRNILTASRRTRKSVEPCAIFLTSLTEIQRHKWRYRNALVTIRKQFVDC